MDHFIALAFTASLITSLLLLFTKHWHGRFSLDQTEGVQKFHSKPTPRVGGVGIVAGMVAGYALAPVPVQALLGPLLLASMPAFAAGMAEDVTKQVGVKARLLATMVSGALACGITGVALDRVGIPMADALLTWMPLAILFTAFAAAGVANAINIIDGFNGLSTGTALIALAALGTIASNQGDAPLVLLCALTASAVAGFWLVNFPLGKLFLGDGGAYFVGFALAWIAVLLLMRNPVVSPWAALMACGYPVIEVLYSVWRRWRSKLSAGAPDSMHLHSLVKTQLILPRFAHWHPRLRNAAVSPTMWLYAGLPAALAVVLEGTSDLVLAAAFAACVLVYHLIYQRLAARSRLHPAVDGDLAVLTNEPAPLRGEHKACTKSTPQP
jgi:UDP-N-acetylmuramyl pentapeptide phosphotransferase/UDP-N-acetylglucosamine-1-phosphate transferase